MNYDQPPQNNERMESEKIIQKLGLKTGTELSLVKQSVVANSSIEVGHKMQGVLKNDVRIGFPIEFNNNANTSNVRNIKEENGKYLIQTLTSTYEIINDTLENKEEKITDFESFETEKGSVYSILENGQVQRTKNILDDPNYRGEDSGQKKEKEPSDIIIFCDPTKNVGWFNDLSAIVSVSGKEKTRAQSIDIGVYKKIDDETYRLVKNNTELDSPFVFVRVMKDDSFKLKEVFSFEELKNFQQRTIKPENKGLGVLITSEGGGITNIPMVGFNTFDYRYDDTGKVASMHNGNKVVSIKKRL